MLKRGSKKIKTELDYKESDLVDFDIEEIDTYSDGVEDSLYVQRYVSDHSSDH